MYFLAHKKDSLNICKLFAIQPFGGIGFNSSSSENNDCSWRFQKLSQTNYSLLSEFRILLYFKNCNFRYLQIVVPNILCVFHQKLSPVIIIRIVINYGNYIYCINFKLFIKTNYPNTLSNLGFIQASYFERQKRSVAILHPPATSGGQAMHLEMILYLNDMFPLGNLVAMTTHVRLWDFVL